MNSHPDALRLFFALWPSQEDAARMMVWARYAHQLCGGRIMRQETLHLTLAFLGETPADKAQALVAAAPSWTARVGTLVLDRFGKFEGPRIVWAGPGGQDGQRVEWLDALHQSVWSQLCALGWEQTPSTFRPHVSLLRRAGPCNIAELRQPPFAWTPAECVLVASQPAEHGSCYNVLARMPLSA